MIYLKIKENACIMDEWQPEYEQMMFGPLHTRTTIDRAAEIKFAHMPSKLYKYRTFSESHTQALCHSVLYSSCPTSFNDFVDTNLVISENAKRKMTQKVYNSFGIRYGFPNAEVTSVQQFLEIAVDYLQRESGETTNLLQNAAMLELSVLLNNKVNQIIEDRQEQMRNVFSACCFSADNKSTLMWAHYADNNQGFCIEYDFKSEGIKADNVQLMFPVLYKSDARVMIDDIDAVDTSYMMYAATVKEVQWQYEKEWRRFYLGNEAGPKPMPEPTAIYLGPRVEKTNMNWMRDFCGGRIDMYKMEYDSTVNSMVPVRC